MSWPTGLTGHRNAPGHLSTLCPTSPLQPHSLVLFLGSPQTILISGHWACCSSRLEYDALNTRLIHSFSSFGAFSNHLSKQHAPPSSQANVQHTTWIRFPSHHLLPSVMVLFLCLIMHDCLSTPVPFWRAEKGIFSLLWPQYLTCNQWRDQQNHNHSTLIVLEIPFSNTFFPPQIWAKGDE